MYVCMYVYNYFTQITELSSITCFELGLQRNTKYNNENRKKL